MKIKTDTIVRTIILALALTNQILTAIGYNAIPIVEDQLAEFLTLAFTIGASVWAWWKNNSFTKNAIKADEVLKELKKEA